MELVKVRLRESSDDSFIYNSWLESQRGKHSNMPKTDYYNHYKSLIADALYKSIVVVACDPESPEFIYGYVVIRPIDDVPIIHYAYVKKPFRKFGILKQLIKSQGIDLKEPLVVTTRPPEFLSNYTLVYKPNLRGI